MFSPQHFPKTAIRREHRERDTAMALAAEATKDPVAAVGPPKRNLIQVSTNKKPLFFYVNLAKRYMEHHNEIVLSALGMAIGTVVTVAEILKNNGLATQKNILTSTIGTKHEANGRLIRKAKMEILLGKSEKFDVMTAAKAEKKGSGSGAKGKGSGVDNGAKGKDSKDSGVDNGAKGKGNGVGNGLKGKANCVPNGAKGKVNGVDNGWKGKANGVPNGAKGKVNGVDNGGKGKASGVDSGAKGKARGVDNGAKGKASGVDNGAKTDGGIRVAEEIKN